MAASTVSIGRMARRSSWGVIGGVQQPRHEKMMHMFKLVRGSQHQCATLAFRRTECQTVLIGS